MTDEAPNAAFRRKHPFSWKCCIRKPQETAENHRFSQETTDFRRKPQIGVRHLRSVTLSLALNQSREPQVREVTERKFTESFPVISALTLYSVFFPIPKEGKPPKKPGFASVQLKSLEKEGKRPQNKEIEKGGSQENSEQQGKEGQGCQSPDRGIAPTQPKRQ